MNLSTIELDKTEARKAFLEYRGAVRERHTAEDHALMVGYRELAAGRQLIKLTETIRAGGEDELRRPKMAVVRADAQQCFMRRQADGNVRFASVQYPTDRSEHGVRSVTLRGVLPAIATGDWQSESRKEWSRTEGDWVSIVPIVPPSLRPSGSLARFHILWEVEAWSRPSRPRVAPRDPALIRHLEGDLWVVLAIWDLTELERAVILGRSS